MVAMMRRKAAVSSLAAVESWKVEQTWKGRRSTDVLTSQRYGTCPRQSAWGGSGIEGALITRLDALSYSLSPRNHIIDSLNLLEGMKRTSKEPDNVITPSNLPRKPSTTEAHDSKTVDTSNMTWRGYSLRCLYPGSYPTPEPRQGHVMVEIGVVDTFCLVAAGTDPTWTGRLRPKKNKNGRNERDGTWMTRGFSISKMKLPRENAFQQATTMLPRRDGVPPPLCTKMPFTFMAGEAMKMAGMGDFWMTCTSLILNAGNGQGFQWEAMAHQQSMGIPCNDSLPGEVADWISQ